MAHLHIDLHSRKNHFNKTKIVIQMKGGRPIAVINNFTKKIYKNSTGIVKKCCA